VLLETPPFPCPEPKWSWCDRFSRPATSAFCGPVTKIAAFNLPSLFPALAVFANSSFSRFRRPHLGRCERLSLQAPRRRWALLNRPRSLSARSRARISSPDMVVEKWRFFCIPFDDPLSAKQRPALGLLERRIRSHGSRRYRSAPQLIRVPLCFFRLREITK